MRYFVSLTHRPEVILKLVSATASCTECCVQAGEVFVVTHLDEPGHGLGWEADEVQVPCSAAHRQVPQLQVDVADTSFTLVEEEQMLFFQNSKYIFADSIQKKLKQQISVVPVGSLTHPRSTIINKGTPELRHKGAILSKNS